MILASVFFAEPSAFVEAGKAALVEMSAANTNYLHDTQFLLRQDWMSSLKYVASCRQERRMAKCLDRGLSYPSFKPVLPALCVVLPSYC